MILDILYVFSLATFAIAALINIAGVNLYDAKQVKRLSHQLKHPHAKPYKKRPLVSIVITGDETGLSESLENLSKLKYKNTEIVVSLLNPTKTAKKLIQNYKTTHVNKQIRYIQKQNILTSVGTLTSAMRQRHGELVLVINSGTLLEKDSIHQAVTRFSLDEEIGILIANKKATAAEDVASIFQSLSLLIKGHVIKTNNYFGMLEQGASFENSFYTKPVLKKLLKAYKDEDLSYLYESQKVKTDYESTTIIYTKSLSLTQLAHQYFNQDRYNTIFWLLRFKYIATAKGTRARGLMLIKLVSVGVFNLALLTWPILLGYFVYLAISLKQPDFLLVSWAAMAIFMCYTILTAERVKYLQKLGYILLIPVYFTWYCISLVLHYLSIVTVPVAFIKDENFA
jgi:hypothetical protein